MTDVGTQTPLPSRFPTKHPQVYYRLNAKGERRYQISYTDSAGKRIFKTVEGQLKDAVRERASILERMHRGERVVRSRMTVKNLVDEYLRTQTAHLKPKTFEGYQYNLDHYVVPRLGHIRLSELAVADIADFILDMRKPTEKKPQGFKKWTIQGCLSPMSSMFRYAVRQGWMAKNPIRDLERQERPKADQAQMRILSTDEINRLIRVDTVYQLLFTTALFTGLRKGELLALAWEDVDLSAGLLQVREGKTAAASRKVVLPEFLVTKLAKEMKTEGTVFRFQKDNVNRALTAALQKAGIDHIRFHDLRHTYASMLISKGAPVTRVSQQMGHANPAITLKVYAQLFDAASSQDMLRGMLQEVVA